MTEIEEDLQFVCYGCIGDAYVKAEIKAEENCRRRVSSANPTVRIPTQSANTRIPLTMTPQTWDLSPKCPFFHDVDAAAIADVARLLQPREYHACAIIEIAKDSPHSDRRRRPFGTRGSDESGQVAGL
jgi:hypothetical protein